MPIKHSNDIKAEDDVKIEEMNDTMDGIEMTGRPAESRPDFSLTTSPYLHVPLRVAIIGSGVSGLAAAKYLLAERVPYTNENCFDATIFEKQSHVAGIWNLNKLTPIYEGLETNVPRTMMEYKDFPYPPKTSLFPTHDKVEKYLESYSSDIRGCINLNSEVTMLTKVTNHDHEKWKLEITDMSTCSSRKFENLFDAIVVATGTFDTIHVPAEVAWTAWEKEYPGSVIHSKAYSDVRKFEGKRVLIIGSGPSYFDIAKRIGPFVKDLLISTTTGKLDGPSSPNQRIFGKVQYLLLQQRGVAFGNSSYEFNIDIVLLCTGYQYNYPFIPRLTIEKGRRLCEIWNQMFWIPDSTLTFVGIPRNGATYRIAEVQSAYIARVLACRLTLPPKHIMKRQTDAELRKYDREYEGPVTRSRSEAADDEFHKFRDPKDKDYINRIYVSAVNAAYENTNPGKQPPYFDDYLCWIRRNTGAMRTAFNSKETRKHRFCSPASLGFSYPGEGKWGRED